VTDALTVDPGAVWITAVEFSAAYDAMRTGLEALLELDSRRMDKTTDVAYQDAAAWGARMAAVIGAGDLVQKFEVAAIRCHSCGDRSS
jgi:hypothetical protein